MSDKNKDTAEADPLTSETELYPRLGGIPAAVGDRFEYEQQLNELPAGQRELAEEVTRHADLCRYFSEEDMQVPPQIVRAVVQARSLAVPERAQRLREINFELMEYLQSVSEDSGLRM